MVSDKGANFCGQVMKQLCKLTQVKKLQTTSFRPSSNVVERCHSSLGNYLRCHIDKNPANWDEFMGSAAFAANNTIHRGTKFTPNDLVFGFSSEIPVALKRKPEPVYNIDNVISVIRRGYQTSWEIARENLGEMKLNSKKYHDRSLNVHQFHVGDLVLVRGPPRAKKLDAKFEGPYRVVHVYDLHNVAILKNKKKVPEVVNVERLLPYYIDEHMGNRKNM